MFCIKCGTQLDDSMLTCPTCQTRTQTGLDLDAKHPLNWFKFLIYFSLWAGAVLNVINGIRTAVGMQYLGNAASVYRVYPAMRFVDIGMCVLMVALAAFGIVTRFRLARFRKNAPTMLYMVYILPVVVTLFYPVATTLVTGMSAFSADVIGQLIGQFISALILVICNIVYFKKRSYLFVN